MEIQLRGAIAQRTQADHSRREFLMSSSSQEPRVSGKPDAVFPSRSNEQGNLFENSTFTFANPSNLGQSLLEDNEDHLLNQTRSELLKQEHQVGSVNNCISELMQQAYAQGLELQDALSSTKRRIIYEGKSASRYSSLKYTRDGRSEESSRTTS